MGKSGEISRSGSVATVLRRFFEEADKDENGYLELEEFIDAIKHFECCAGFNTDKLRAIGAYVDLNNDGRLNYAELLSALCVRHVDGTNARKHGPKALLEDMLEAVHRVLYFEYAKPLRTMLRHLSPPGCTRCTPAKFQRALVALNDGVGCGLLTVQQICSLVESLDVNTLATEQQGHFDFEDYFNSFEIVDTFAD